MSKCMKPSRNSALKTYILNNSSLDEIVLSVEEYSLSVKMDAASSRRCSFLIDNVLDYWIMHGAEGREISVSFGKRFFTPFVSIVMDGEKLDPYDAKKPDFGESRSDVVVLSGQIADFEYIDGRNVVTLSLKREKSMMREIGIVTAAAVTVGILGNLLLPEATREYLLSVIIGPVTDMFFNVMRCIAGPMVFISVIWGICGIGDSRMFGRVGRRVLLYSVGITALGAVVGAFSFPFIGNGLQSSAGMGGELSSLFDMILGIVPSSIVDPFSTGNTLQIIFLAITVGIAMITMSNKVGRLIVAIEQFNLVVNTIMGVISGLVPFIVFLLIMNMIWTDSLHLVSSMWKLFLAIIGSFTVVSILICLITSVKQKTGILNIAKKNVSSFIVALTTASSAAAFSTNLNAARKNYGISEKLAVFSIPLGMIVHNPIAACYNIVLSIYFAASYGVSCSIGWLIIGIIVCTVIAISSPPIPGGAAVSYALLLAQMGIPEEALAVVLVIDVITDFLVTAFECYVLPISLVNIAKPLDQLDLDTLRKK